MYSRKTKVIALFLVLAAVVIYGWKKEWFGSGGIHGGLWDAIPENSCLVAEIPAWGTLQAAMDTLSYGDALGASLMGETIAGIFSQYKEYSDRKSDVASLPFLASYHLAKVGQLDLLLVIENESLAKSCRKSLKKIKDGIVTSYQYKRRDIFQVTDSLGNKLTIAMVNNLVLASYTSFLVEDAIAQLIVGSSLISDARSKLVSGESKGKMVRILSYYPNTSLWLGGFMSSKDVKQKNNWSTFANASLLELELLPGSVKARGKTYVAEGNLVQQFAIQASINSIHPLTRSVHPFLLSPSPGNKLERFFSGWFGGTGWEVQLPSLCEKEPQQMLLIPSSENISRMDTLIQLMGIKLPAGNTGAKMLKVPASWQKRVLGKSYFKTDSLWILMVDTALMAVSPSEVALTTLQWVTETSPMIPNFKESVSSPVYKMYYSNRLNFSTDEKGKKEDEVSNIYSSLQAKLSSLSVEFASPVNGLSETTISLDLTSRGRDTVALPWWSAETATDIIRGPFIVQDSESIVWILAQDSLRTVYCWDADGRIQWKKTLDGPLIGEGFALDYYGNGQMQVMLATSKTVYCMNNKGAQAGGYPLRLSATAVAITHTGRDANGKLYITASSGDIYVFELNGRPVQGMSPLKAAARNVPVSADASTGTIVAVLKDGTLKAWKPDGKMAWTAKLKVAAGTLPIMTATDSSGKIWTCLQENGDLAYINPSGKFSTVKYIKPGVGGIFDGYYGWSFQKGVFSYLQLNGLTVFSTPLPGATKVTNCIKLGSMIGVSSNNGSYWIDTAWMQRYSASSGNEGETKGFFFLPLRQVYGFSSMVDKHKVRVWLLPVQ